MQLDLTPGTVALLPDSRAATLTDIQPYTRRDGGASAILTWRLACATCSTPYTVTTGREGTASRNMKIKNCPAHRSTWAEIVERNRKIGEVNREHKAAIKASKVAERAARKAERSATLAQMRRTPNPLGHPRRKISDEDVAEIRRLSTEGLSSKDLAVVFPVSDSTIRNILRGARRAG